MAEEGKSCDPAKRKGSRAQLASNRELMLVRLEKNAARKFRKEISADLYWGEKKRKFLFVCKGGTLHLLRGKGKKKNL